MRTKKTTSHEKKRKLVGYAKRKFSWERTRLTSIKAKLDKAHRNNLTPHARAMAKPRRSGSMSGSIVLKSFTPNIAMAILTFHM